MPKSGFSICYEIITRESAEHGEAESTGFICEDVSFQDVMSDLYWHRGAYVEASEYPVHAPRWFTFYNVREDFSTGETENWSLHIPESVTPASRRRIAKLIGCYGVK